MKKRYLLFVLLTFILGLGVCNAASISVRASASEVKVGSTFTVTVTVNGVGQSAGAVGAWKYCLDFNNTNLTLVSPASPCVNDGVVGLRQATATYTFKANTTAENVIGLSGVLLYDYDSEQSLPVEKGSAKVNASLQETNKQINDNSNLSSNANLRILEVVGYTLTPEFSKDKTEYTLEVPGDVETVQVNAYREDTTSQITPIDMVNLTEGANKVTVTVTAAKGNKKTYTITITRGEEEPIKVEVDGKEYSVVNKEGALEVPAGYVATTVDIDGKEVKAYINEQVNITIVVLKDSESNMAYYMFKDGKFSPYQQITGSAITIIPIEKEMSGVALYSKSKNISIGEKEVKVFYKEGAEDIVLIYGINTTNGEEGWYYYDTKDGSLFKYIIDGASKNDRYDKVIKGNNDYKLLTLIFAGVSGLALILIIALVLYVSKLKNKNEELFVYMEDRMRKHRDKKFNNIVEKDIEKSEAVPFDDTNTNILTDDVLEDNHEKIEEPEEDEVNEKLEITFDDDTILLREEDMIDLDEDDYEEEPKKKKEKEPTLISDTDILRNIAKANEKSFQDEKPKKATKKEEKMMKKKEKALAKKAQKEFLDDVVFEESAFDIYEREETEVIPVVKKKPRTKGRKKS